LSNHREVVMSSPMMYCIFGHANDLSFRIFPQAQEQFSSALIVQKFLPRNRLDLIQGDQIEPSESLHRFHMCFNKAILFHSVILFIPSPPSFLEDISDGKNLAFDNGKVRFHFSFISTLSSFRIMRRLHILLRGRPWL